VGHWRSRRDIKEKDSIIYYNCNNYQVAKITHKEGRKNKSDGKEEEGGK